MTGAPAYRPALLVAALLVAGIMLTPLLAAQPPSASAFFSYFSFHFICHQDSDRSFHLNGSALPVCARCCGIYIGALATLLALGLLRRTDPPLPARFWLPLLMAPMALDVLARNVGWHHDRPDLLLRALTGFIFSTGFTCFLIPMLNQAWREILTARKGELSW